MYGIPLLHLLLSGRAALSKAILNRLNSPFSKQLLEQLFKELLILENFPNLLDTDIQEEDKFKWVFNAIYSLNKLSEEHKEDHSEDEISFDFETNHFADNNEELSFDFGDDNSDEMSFEFDSIELDDDAIITEFSGENDDGYFISEDKKAYESFRENLNNTHTSHYVNRLIFALRNPNSPLSKKSLPNIVKNLGMSESSIPYLEKWIKNLKETYTGDLKYYVKSGDDFVTEKLNLDSSATGPLLHQVAFKLAKEIAEIVKEHSAELEDLKLLLTQRLSEANYSDMLFNRPYKILNSDTSTYNVDATFNTILKPLTNMTENNRARVKQKYLNDLSVLNQLSNSEQIFDSTSAEKTVDEMFKGDKDMVSIDSVFYTKDTVTEFVNFFKMHNINIMDLAEEAPRTFGTLYNLYLLIVSSPPLSALFPSIKEYLDTVCPAIELDDTDLLSRHNNMKAFNESRLNRENDLINQLNDLFVSKMLFPSLVYYKNALDMLPELLKASNNLTLKPSYSKPSEKLLKSSILFWRCLRER